MSQRSLILSLVCTSYLLILSSGEVRVTPKLYVSAQLPCKFPSIKSSEELTLVWVKEEDDGTTLVVHKFTSGQDDVSDQDPQYRGRTQLLGDISKGNLELTLTEVTSSDEGKYCCRAANRKCHEESKVELSIEGLEADDPTVTFNHESQRMKCIARGRFRDPQVKWHNRQKEDLSNFATLNTVTLRDGWMMVESVLEYNVDKRDHYFCHIEEGGHNTSVHRAVISDGVNPVRVDDEL